MVRSLYLFQEKIINYAHVNDRIVHAVGKRAYIWISSKICSSSPYKYTHAALNGFLTGGFTHKIGGLAIGLGP